jgi:hydroxyacylglutathione hydrolase
MYRTAEPFTSVKVTEHLNCYLWQGMGNNCNSILFYNVLKGDKPHVLIDPGHISNEFRENCFEYLSRTMEKDGYKMEQVGMVINTHSHTDHCEANVVLVKNNKAAIAMSKEEDEFRHTGGKKLDAMFGIKTPQFETSIFLKEGDFKLGDDVELQLYLSPGHSPGAICLYWPIKKILITGDVVFYGSVGRTDFPGCDGKALKASIERLSHLDVETLIPGHATEMGSIIEGKVNVQRNFQMVNMYF